MLREMRKIDPVILLLFFGIMFFTGILFVAEKWFPSDGQFFQVVSGLLTGFGGAFFMGIKNELGLKDAPPGTIAQTTVQTTLQGPPPA